MLNNKSDSAANLTSGHLLARNTIFNLIGAGVPILVAIFAIPLLIDGLGTARFGVLTLAWVVVGYFSLFDLGIGRALTKLVADRLGDGRSQEIPPLAWTALILVLLLGIVGSLIVVMLSPWLVGDVLNIPEALYAETLKAFYLLALSIPVVITTTGLRGILESYQHFGLINAIRIPMGIFIFVGPLLVLPFSNSLYPVVAILVAGRVVAWLAHLFFCLQVVPELRNGIVFKSNLVKPILSFGSWMTISNIVGPFMVYMDRFVIGAVLSITEVAYYTTPYEVITKVWIIPLSLVGVLFPAFANTLSSDRPRAVVLFGRGVNYTFLAVFPITLLIVTLAHEGLNLWLGEEFASKSAVVLQWLAVGVFINSVARFPFALIQADGRPDITAKLHILELPLYLVAIFWLINVYGIEGVAIAWTMRLLIDTLLLFVMAQKLLPDCASHNRRIALAMALALLTLLAGTFISHLLIKVLFLSISLLVFIVALWFFMLAKEERALIWKRLKMVHISN